MPTRPGVALILLFWAAVTGYVGYRDVWPRYFADAPPAVRIELSDEATQAVPARWIVWRGDKKIGSLTTRMAFDPADDTFRFVSTYTDLTFDVSGLRVRVPELQTELRVTRAGDLRGQTMTGKLVGSFMAGPVTLFQASASAEVTGVVKDGVLVGRCKILSPDFGDIEDDLEPTPVPGGQVLNPLQPVNRLQDVRTGRRWVIREVNPLSDAMAALGRGLLKKHAGNAMATFTAKPGDRPQMLAEVLSRTEMIPRPGLNEPAVECRVIEYRGDKTSAKTWVAVADGKVLRQTATTAGETLRLERDD